MVRFRRRWPGGRRQRRRRRIVTAVLVLTVLPLALLTGYLLYLDQLITETFEGRRWSIPAQVYAAPLEIYAGRALSRAELVTELERVGYHRGDPDRPGGYALTEGAVEVTLRSFAFQDGYREALPLTIRFAGHRIAHVTGDNGGVPIVRLEPPVIGSFFTAHGEDRLIVPPDEMPALLTDTLIAVEDRSFFEHPGFDLSGIARAMWVNLRAGEVRQGGSTLTQQLIKSYYLDNRRTLIRKLRELAMAVILELRFEKIDILNAYVNEVYIGQDGNRAIHGFGLASQFYFNKPLGELRAHEIALLVAILRGPAYYNPYQHAERALERRDRVLGVMHEFALIDASTLATALAEPLDIVTEVREGGRYYPAFMDLVRAQLAEDYAAEDLASANLRIFTTLNPRIQESAERAVAETLAGIEAARDLPPGELEAAVLVSHTPTGEVLAVVGGRNPGFQGFNRAVSARRPVGSLIKPAVYLTALESGEYHLASIIDDAPVRMELPTGIWEPHNFDNELHGPVPLVRALGDSMNLATVRLGMEIGVENVAAQVARLAGVEAPAPYPSLLLGAVALTPLDMLRMYGVIASGGFNAPVKSVLAVMDERGNTLSRYPIDVRQIVDHDDVTELTVALMTVMQHGTGQRSRFSDAGVAGKTGTSDNYRDSWFAGFDSEHLALVWLGYDDNRSSGLTGAAGARRVWDALMADLGVTPLRLGVPPDWKVTSIDYETGLRADDDCGEVVQVPLPADASLPLKPGCSMSLRELGKRVREWFR